MTGFKRMKFWVGDDVKLSAKIQSYLVDLGYSLAENHTSYQYEGLKYLYTYSSGNIGWGGRCTHSMRSAEEYFKTMEFEEINVDWMRTSKVEVKKVVVNNITYSEDYLESLIDADLKKQMIAYLKGVIQF